MNKFDDIEQLFLSVLQGDAEREKIEDRMRDLCVFAAKNGLFPVIYSRLSALNLKDIPFKALYYFNLKQNLLFEKESLRVIRHLSQAGIPVMPLKGALLTRYVYGDLSMRQAPADIDLLVPRDKAREAEEVLKDLGYCTDEKTKEGHYRYSNQVLFFKPAAGTRRHCNIDLHWAVRDRYACLENMTLASSNEDLVFYLSLVAIYDDNFIQLKYLYDLHCLIARFKNDIDWQVLAERAQRSELGCALFFAAELSRDLFHTALPQWFLDAIRPASIKYALLRRWLNKKNIFRFRKKTFLSFIWHFFFCPYLFSKNIFGCAKLIYKKIFKPVDEVMWAYNRPSSRLYYLYIKRLFKPFLCDKISI